MSSPSHLAAVLLLVAGCRPDRVEVPTDPTLELDLTSPQYGAFLGDEAAEVTGRVNTTRADVTVEGEPVELSADGRFSVGVPVDGPYRNIDVVAVLGDQRVREHVPVFSGLDPLETWPGGLTARVLQPGLDALGARVGAVIDTTGWDAALAAALPEVDLGWVVMTPTGVTHDDTTLDLRGAEGGIVTGISLHGLRLLYDVGIDLWGITWDGEAAIGYATVTIASLAVPEVDEDGIVRLSLTDPEVTMSDASLEVAGLDLFVLEWLLDAVNASISEPIAASIGDLLLSQVGTLELGGPFEIQTSLMGSDLAVALHEVYGDPDGLGVELGMALTGLPEVDDVALAAPRAAGLQPDDAQLAIGLHEGLFQVLLTGDLLDMLSQDMDLSGTYGELIGGGLRNLPGGEQAPDGDGWCLSIRPGDAQVARLQEGIAPLAMLYLPDFQLDVGTLDGPHCLPWIEASLAVELGLGVEAGTKLAFDLTVDDGILWAYGADAGTYDEAEVVAGLSSYLETMLGLLGGAFQLDLGDLLGGAGGGPAGGLDLQIVGSTAMVDDDDAPMAGAFAVTVNAWSE